MTHLKVSVLFLLSLLILAVLSLPSPSPIEAQTEEVVREVELEGGVLYTILDLGSENELKVYDISDPESPVEIGSLPIRDDPALNMKVAGDLAYLEVGFKVWIVDLSDPTDPVVLDQSLDTKFGFTAGGRYVYIKNWTVDGAVITIYRVDDNGLPQYVSHYTEPSSSGPGADPSAAEESMDDGEMVLDWPILYYTADRAIDVSDPENPARHGGFVMHFAVSPWSVHNGVGYGVNTWPNSDCLATLFVTGSQHDWGDPPWRQVDAFEDHDGYPYSYEIAWGTYLMIGSPGRPSELECSTAPYFLILDFSEFSFSTGEGSASVIHHDESLAVDSAYHKGAGIIYVARGEGGLDVMQAPFPTYNHHAYFPALPVR